MNTSRQFKFRVAMIVVAVTAFLMSTDFPQGSGGETGPAQSVLPRSEHARTVPISDKVITVKFTLDDDQDVRASVFEGGLIRLEKAGQAAYGFSPVISDPSGGTMMIKVFRISSLRSSGKIVGESLKEVHALIVDRADGTYFTTYADSDASFRIEVLDVQAESQRGGEAVTAQHYAPLVAECCVTCGGWDSCSTCAIATSCGGCCRGSCCK